MGKLCVSNLWVSSCTVCSEYKDTICSYMTRARNDKLKAEVKAAVMLKRMLGLGYHLINRLTSLNSTLLFNGLLQVDHVDFQYVVHLNFVHY